MKVFRKWCLLLCAIGLSLSVMAQEKAKPVKGEGIHAFLRRHNRTGQDSYQQFLELNKGKFGKGNSLILSREYLLPGSAKPSVPANTTHREPLFGKKQAAYTVTSDRLKGACFFLVCGHGGPDPGAIGKYGKHELHEDEYAYDIMLRLARILLCEGAKVHIIIRDPNDGIRDGEYLTNSKNETCMGDAIPLNQIKRLDQRCEKINALSRKATEKYQRAIFIHLDSRSKKHRLDVFFYHHPNSKPGERLSETMKKTFKKQYSIHQPSRGFEGTVSARNLHVLRNTRPVGIYVELGNIQNSFDQRRFVLSSNREALAKWLSLGFIRDYEEHKKGQKK